MIGDAFARPISSQMLRVVLLALRNNLSRQPLVQPHATDTAAWTPAGCRRLCRIYFPSYGQNYVVGL